MKVLCTVFLLSAALLTASSQVATLEKNESTVLALTPYLRALGQRLQDGRPLHSGSLSPNLGLALAKAPEPLTGFPFVAEVRWPLRKLATTESPWSHLTQQVPTIDDASFGTEQGLWQGEGAEERFVMKTIFEGKGRLANGHHAGIVAHQELTWRARGEGFQLVGWRQIDFTLLTSASLFFEDLTEQFFAEEKTAAIAARSWHQEQLI